MEAEPEGGGGLQETGNRAGRAEGWALGWEWGWQEASSPLEPAEGHGPVDLQNCKVMEVAGSHPVGGNFSRWSQGTRTEDTGMERRGRWAGEGRQAQAWQVSL